MKQRFVMTGYSILYVPRDWHFGAWHRPTKSLYSFGPFRFVVHTALGVWKPTG